jgi:tetratricopeptide (TPR) repeat protein
MNTQQEQAALQQVDLIMEQLAPDPVISCSKHQEVTAVMSCVVCGQGICQQCLADIPDSYKFTCAICTTRKIKKKIVFTGLKSLKSPVLWVLLCVLISAIAYAMGIGNPRLKTLKKRDLKWNWYSQDVGKMYLSKASRENQRAAALRMLDKPEEALVWNKRACKAFQLAAEYWAKTPVHGYLLAAVAHQYYWDGKYDKALKILKSLKFEHGDPATVGLNYMLGQVYEKIGNKKLAKASFTNAINEERSSYSKKMDNFITTMTGNRREARMVFMVRVVCELKIKPDALREKEKEYDIKDPSSFSFFNTRVKIPKIKSVKKPEKKTEPPPDEDEPLQIEKLDGPPKKSKVKKVQSRPQKPKQPVEDADDELKIEFLDKDK